jgi:hypothetical protein
MDYEVIFYVSGAVLAVSAIVFTFVGLRSERFPGPVVALWFIALVGVTTTFAVLHSQHEEEHREHEAGVPHAAEEAEQIEDQASDAE